MTLLRDVVPMEFFQSYMNTRAATMLDCKVVKSNESWNSAPWPGSQQNVHNWWTLEDGRCVGWNESPSHGWSFPVHGKKTKSV